MQERQDTPLGTLQPQTRCLRCGDVLEWSEEHSVLLGCSCCSTVDEALENVARGLASRMKKEKSHWAAGRVGDIDFIGTTKTRGKFVRVSSNTDPVLIYQMLTEEWGLAPPHLVVALVGGDELAQMKPWLRDTLRKGLVKAAQSTGAWILTNGLRFGITKHLGQAVRDHSLASTSSKVRVVAIGIAPWNMIHNREALLTAKVDEPAAYKPQDLPHGSVYSLDSHHSHFVLVEEDPDRPGATSEMRVKLLKHISLQRTGYGGAGSFEIPVLCLLVHGEPRILKRMYKGIGNSTPWLILAGSGGVADILVTLMNRGCWDTDSVHELLLDTFPNAHHSTDISNWVKLIQRILDHGHLLTVHDPEQESSELDTVILKALVKACKSQSQEAQDFLDELKLAVAWNRADIAKSDIFNGDVEWKACDLEEVMMDALINDKPDFVRLFVDNGVNLGEFLTYGRLQELYWSVSEKSLLHNLLLKKYEEKQLLLGAARTPGPPGHHPPEQGKPRFTLYEVAKVLKDFLHESCKGFYQKIPTEKPAKGRLFHSQKNLAELEERCEHPWRDLFLWAVLQNRQQMANYFWAMVSLVSFFSQFSSSSYYLSTVSLTKTGLCFVSEENTLLEQIYGPQLTTEADAKSSLPTMEFRDSPPGDPAAQSCASVCWRFLLRRWRRFWSAPVTVFLGNVIMYFAFLCLFTYVLLLDFRPPLNGGPGAPEIMPHFWVSPCAGGITGDHQSTHPFGSCLSQARDKHDPYALDPIETLPCAVLPR
ncbi:transient receptor potential cation channel subfamily M member 5 [Lates japonicus]|uniref:Transient receptor potential cation channel subfamily M member 5 n=1 Tax=Lates japonicus TaxID=270547 RepID=A0AAD3R5E9_LATJO|nr:transient receptor potential cation channel subfamily M member 5 [Lates japonicus]